jgi:hypothetical protein
VERFEGNRGLALRFGATAVFLMAVATVPAVAGALRFASLTGANAALVVFSVGCLCAMGLLSLYAARDASASFVVDEEGITRHAWGRTTALAWRDIVREREFHPTLFKGAADVSWRWVLYDRHGRKLIIPVRWLEIGPRLSALVEPHLASLRAAELRELARRGGQFRPGLKMGLALLACIIPVVLLTALSPSAPTGAGALRQDSDRKPLMIFCLVVSAVLVVLGAELISRKLAVTNSGVTLRSLFLNRSIPFGSVKSITVKLIDPEEQIVRRAILHSCDGQKISFDSDVPCFRTLLELIRERAGHKAYGSVAADPDFS